MNEELKINGRAIYTTKGAAREYGRVGCNFYKGCPHGCEYCYLKRGVPSKQLGGNEAVLKKCFKDEEDARQVFIRETLKHLDYLRQTGVFFSFTTDPLIPETWELTKFAAVFANHHGIPVKILTKNAGFFYNPTVVDYFMAPDVEREDITFGFTLTGRDDMEPNASTNMERINAMKHLHGLGFKTFASIEPVIDWQRAQAVISLSVDHCDHYKIGLRSGVKKDYYNLVQSGDSLQRIVGFIIERSKTVYLKESTRKLLRCFLVPDGYEAFMSYTVDMDGKPYKKQDKQ